MDNHTEQRLKDLEHENNDLKIENARLLAKIEEYRNKEQTISSAIIASMEHANQLEASRKKLYLLDIQRSRLMYFRMERVINELYRKYPELKKDNNLKDMSEKFKSMIFNDLNDKEKGSLLFDNKKQTMTDDPIKRLLHNIIDCFDSKKLDTDKKEDFEKFITPKPSSSGFDINEALHPTMDLAEIMKSFNLGDNKKDEQ